MMRPAIQTLAAAVLGLIPVAASAQSQRNFEVGNRKTERLLDRGNQQMIDMTQPRFGGSPPFPLFRCDGQRPPMFGGGHCPNWQLHELQMKVLKQQYELQRRQLQKQRN